MIPFFLVSIVVSDAITLLAPRLGLRTRSASAGSGNMAKGGAVFVLVLIVSSILYGWIGGPSGLSPMGQTKLSASLFVFGIVIFIVWRFALENLPKQLKGSKG